MAQNQTGATDEQLFVGIVSDLVSQAWIALGKIKNPLSDKIERNIPATGMIIDMLDMLVRKTEGNRSPDEDRLLKDSLQSLKLNFVAETNKPDEPAEEQAEPDASEPGEQASSSDTPS